MHRRRLITGIVLVVIGLGLKFHYLALPLSILHSTTTWQGITGIVGLLFFIAGVVIIGMATLPRANDGAGN